ncbi:hypothetical protein J2848_004509 [Azospirillum lipoferum]|uniref:Uncharacterized protein n=1 Tax=Azospirillum lipoferum TaxID=193 RepID=A0A5A9GM20_AZOLI|nr:MULTISPECIES: hypothetical protein [Azospirillum]KAA0594855.1 hypothetical protein FZ942_18795 [Azospirillum lipoferum]MCP1612817.1 hypothetical protein [Azospirillum lipoferum]MDW5532044.1 hypothetical protein [Azospirillum sp. NL1]
MLRITSKRLAAAQVLGADRSLGAGRVRRRRHFEAEVDGDPTLPDSPVQGNLPATLQLPGMRFHHRRKRPRHFGLKSSASMKVIVASRILLDTVEGGVYA